MRRFLYFIPGLNGINAGLLAKAGLTTRFTEAGSEIGRCSQPISSGPAGAGVVVAAGEQAPDVSAETKWTECQAFWLAIEDPHRPPGPADLQRMIGVNGYQLLLGDGNLWTVPLIHRFDPETLYHVPNVPTSIAPVLGRDGNYKIQRTVHRSFAAVDALASRTFSTISGSGEIKMSVACADAAALLALNYRLEIEEIELLALLDGENVLEVLKAAIDAGAMAATAERLN